MDSKQYAGISNCQSTDFRKLAFHFNASLAVINLAKAACKKLKNEIFNIIMQVHNTQCLYAGMIYLRVWN